MFPPSVGDCVRVQVDVRDGRGNQLCRGGDDIRVVLQEPNKGAFLSTDVHDLGNGSYIADIPLLWEGSPYIKASLSYNTELVRAHQYVRSALKSLKFISAVFQTKFASEATLCDTLPILSWYKNTCNLTEGNGGIEWYCGRPGNTKLDCSNWSYNIELDFVNPLPLTKAELELNLLVKSDENLGNLPLKININVSKALTRNNNFKKLNNNITEINLQSWQSNAPRGHFFKESWIPRFTNDPILEDPRRIACLHNTTILLSGDSNMRLAFERLSRRVGCRINTGVVHPKWHHPLSCIDKKKSIKIYWQIHALPFHTAAAERKPREDTKSTVTFLDEIPTEGKYVVMIHLYLHFTVHHYVVFLKHIRAIRQALDRVLTRNPQVKLVIRGPHMSMKKWDTIQGGDVLAHIYTRIIKQELKGLYDKVYFLQPWDMTVAIESRFFHPPNMVNDPLADMVLKYICLT